MVNLGLTDTHYYMQNRSKQINNKDLLPAISYFWVQYLVITYNVRKYEEKKIYFNV